MTDKMSCSLSCLSSARIVRSRHTNSLIKLLIGRHYFRVRIRSSPFSCRSRICGCFMEVAKSDMYTFEQSGIF